MRKMDILDHIQPRPFGCGPDGRSMAYRKSPALRTGWISRKIRATSRARSAVMTRPNRLRGSTPCSF